MIEKFRCLIGDAYGSEGFYFEHGIALEADLVQRLEQVAPILSGYLARTRYNVQTADPHLIAQGIADVQVANPLSGP